MSDGFVADSSIGVAWAVMSQSSEATGHLLSEVASGTPLVVPVLWGFEVANALLVLTRRKRIETGQYARARRALSRLNPTVDEEGPRVALGRIADLAEEHALSVYDAAYLELAIRRGLPLASRDADLNKAAQASGVRTLL
ncbi:MAG: type II toxin-antitoxin system VapC family toxin [Acidobacteriota bacterium]